MRFRGTTLTGIFCCSSHRIHLMNSGIGLFNVSIISRLSLQTRDSPGWSISKGDTAQTVLQTRPQRQPYGGLAGFHIISHKVQPPGSGISYVPTVYRTQLRPHTYTHRHTDTLAFLLWSFDTKLENKYLLFTISFCACRLISVMSHHSPLWSSVPPSESD